MHNIPLVPADAVSEGGSVDEFAIHIYANSTKTAYIDREAGLTYPRERATTFH
jgi:hypothetical protein